jgi:hypothetical protein
MLCTRKTIHAITSRVTSLEADKGAARNLKAAGRTDLEDCQFVHFLQPSG